ncbi:MAG TPA: hypothetical protein VHQ90_13430 [Thermoanaerobaculia bacterium]|nr:hypothetical protein [Thermoanaerobaculia bacterium]
MATSLAAQESSDPALPVDSPTVERVRGLLPQPLRAGVRSARELDREIRQAEREAPLATAVPALDRLLAGGLPRGHLVEIVGARSSGRFSMALAALATATRVGEAAALVDLGDALDPQLAVVMEVDLERLLWLRPETLKQALAGAEMLIGSGFPLVVLDLGQPPVRGGRGAAAAWLRLARAARAHDAALLVGSPYRVSGTAASVVLEARRERTVWQGGGGQSSHAPSSYPARRKTPGPWPAVLSEAPAGPYPVLSDAPAGPCPVLSDAPADPCPVLSDAPGPCPALAARGWLLGGIALRIAAEKHRGCFPAGVAEVGLHVASLPLPAPAAPPAPMGLQAPAAGSLATPAGPYPASLDTPGPYPAVGGRRRAAAGRG